MGRRVRQDSRLVGFSGRARKLRRPRTISAQIFPVVL